MCTASKVGGLVMFGVAVGMFVVPSNGFAGWFSHCRHRRHVRRPVCRSLCQPVCSEASAKATGDRADQLCTTRLIATVYTIDGDCDCKFFEVERCSDQSTMTYQGACSLEVGSGCPGSSATCVNLDRVVQLSQTKLPKEMRDLFKPHYVSRVFADHGVGALGKSIKLTDAGTRRYILKTARLALVTSKGKKCVLVAWFEPKSSNQQTVPVGIGVECSGDCVNATKPDLVINSGKYTRVVLATVAGQQRPFVVILASPQK